MKEKVVGGAKMNIREIKENKKEFLDLLLLADEQENMRFCRWAREIAH